MPTKEELILFEDSIASDFAAGLIKAPVHLSGGNEEQLINIFQRDIKPWDWVLAGWRSHYHCLLKGVPPEQLRQAIHQGRSVSLSFREQNVFCSGICGGIAPIAVGIAWSLRRSGSPARVHVFLGDMSAEMGIVYESTKYAANFELPISWYVEDNLFSVSTDTQLSWGNATLEGGKGRKINWLRSYRYTLTRPHCGIGKWVAFK